MSQNPAPEQVIFSIRPAFLFVGIKYVIAAVLWLAASALVAAGTSWFELPIWVGGIAVVVVGLVLFARPMLSHLDRQRHLFTLTDHKFEVQYGLLTTTTRNIPLSKIQDVTVTASLVNRLLGLGNIVVENASEAGGQIVIAGVSEPKRYADLLLNELRRGN
ncbi:MAG: PH domain-containing protein [Acidobacteria bacterium]|nr:PH domain-containing protein [Acidobacteriota bacterium]